MVDTTPLMEREQEQEKKIGHRFCGECVASSPLSILCLDTFGNHQLTTHALIYCSRQLFLLSKAAAAILGGLF